MNIVFTCGGTGGHIYPAIAVARLFQQRQPGCSILFIGAEDGMENKIVPREGFRLETLKISDELSPRYCHRHRWLRELSGAARGRETFDSDHGPRIKRRAWADDPDGGKIHGPDYGLV